jgi:hypothetical protein
MLDDSLELYQWPQVYFIYTTFREVPLRLSQTFYYIHFTITEDGLIIQGAVWILG